MTIALTLLQFEGSHNNLGLPYTLVLYSLPPPRHYSLLEFAMDLAVTPIQTRNQVRMGRGHTSGRQRGA